ncbi:hypothetical protein [Bradyrhizobium sp. Ash2021]|uniref:hypothetical protein n=1 Tax=Bradyrhizobium sp. Ash2021 TaxID=2954771 RepID=UPI002815EC21|nr:hypothetical protein [Bradyrhizobium sp. Ash2021]WMT79589.1 hypothetical protein NL528_44965 [Bradyrhizobium sp. Ash2021]
MTLRISATPHQDHIVLEIADANGESGASIGLSRDDALALIGSIANAVNALPHDSSIPIHQQRAFLRAKHPSFQVGLASDGGTILAIQPSPFPPIEFEFDADSLSKLIADLRKAANVPSHPQGKPS